ncbi:putative aspartate aminotransferase [Myriangium duriaei CBS 260.36]|uniref:Aspartate aminotransferase n=1 Tax=Myriangium duriaei CBS 260.36 TaxID=1168546 RepID=A0A9P4MI33_9PEZI|nr:putative aspartate aminotransferase [Myriangium duriaei CBS 260.36]
MAANLSHRAAAVAKKNNNLLWDVLGDLWDPETNPGGYVSVGVADNMLMQQELLDYIRQRFGPELRHLTYNDGPSGSNRLRKATAHFLTRQLQPHQSILPEHVSITNGVSAATEHLAWSLCDHGDVVLLGRPYYRAFLKDLGLRPNTNIIDIAFIDVDCMSDGALPLYEQAMKQNAEAGNRIKAVMICNPHNPLGRCYSKRFLVGLLKLCQTYQIHLISDEIYALSVWRTGEGSPSPLCGFTSVLALNTSGIIDPSLVHVIWGVSKDLGSNGLRMGAIISQSNPLLLEAVQATSIYSCISGLADHTVCNILEDDQFIEGFIEKNKQQLYDAYTYMTHKLDQHQIDYDSRSNAGLFVWCDLLSAFFRLQKRTVSYTLNEKKRISDQIYNRLLEQRVFIGRGEDFGHECPGWARLTFSQSRANVDEAILRIVGVLRSHLEEGCD